MSSFRRFFYLLENLRQKKDVSCLGIIKAFIVIERETNTFENMHQTTSKDINRIVSETMIKYQVIYK